MSEEREDPIKRLRKERENADLRALIETLDGLYEPLRLPLVIQTDVNDAGDCDIVEADDEIVGYVVMSNVPQSYARFIVALVNGYPAMREALTDALVSCGLAVKRWEAHVKRAERAEALLVKLDKCLSGHLIGVNCKGPVLDDETVKDLRAALRALEEPDAERE
jgi:hypothetical protein